MDSGVRMVSYFSHNHYFLYILLLYVFNMHQILVLCCHFFEDKTGQKFLSGLCIFPVGLFWWTFKNRLTGPLIGTFWSFMLEPLYEYILKFFVIWKHMFFFFYSAFLRLTFPISRFEPSCNVMFLNDYARHFISLCDSVQLLYMFWMKSHLQN